MSENTKPEVGTIGWFDLTVENADAVKDFYASVVGWKVDEISMGDYSDYVMKLPVSGTPFSGVCHQRGGNKGIPPYWMMYITVANLERSRDFCVANGGKLLSDVKDYPGQGKFCFIEDPAGAPCALFEYI
ncbi:MAG: VOC family protein [Ignavibacteriales bacterium]|nr:VOC family protein [Ignavibacteriales bacterium]